MSRFKLANSTPHSAVVLLKEASYAWVEDDASTFGAALAFYAVFSLAPILIVSIAMAGFSFGQEALKMELIRESGAWGGHHAAALVQTIIQGAAERPKLGVIATVIGVVTIFIGASGTFIELQTALNWIWKAKPRSEKFWIGEMKKRSLSFGLVLATGFLLLLSVVLSAALASVGKFIGELFPPSAFLAESIHFVLSFAILTFLFAVIFKVLPDTFIDWSDVWIGAAVTSLLFTIGKFLIGLYLGRTSMASVYGTTGSLVIVLLWVYYSAQIFLLGAEFTRIYAERHGSRAKQVPGSLAA